MSPKKDKEDPPAYVLEFLYTILTLLILSSDPFADTEVKFEGERPYIKKDPKVRVWFLFAAQNSDKSEQAPKFGVNETVYADLGNGSKGPYTVARVNLDSIPPTYVLEAGDESAVNGGHGIKEAKLSTNPL